MVDVLESGFKKGPYSRLIDFYHSALGPRVIKKKKKLGKKKGSVQVGTLSGHTGWVFSAAFSPDGKRVVSGSEDKLVKIWNVETSAEVIELMRVYPTACIYRVGLDSQLSPKWSTCC